MSAKEPGIIVANVRKLPHQDTVLCLFKVFLGNKARAALGMRELVMKMEEARRKKKTSQLFCFLLTKLSCLTICFAFIRKGELLELTFFFNYFFGNTNLCYVD